MSSPITPAKPRPTERPRLRAFPTLLPILLLAFALRLAIARALPLESDEAISGITALHILQGERPVFFYGQTYMGVLEAYLVAPVFAVAGASTLTLRLVPIALSLVFCATSYLLGRRLYGTLAGTLAALYVGVSPLFLTIWGVKARTGYAETLAFGGLLLLLLLDVAYDGRREPWRPVALGLLAGLAFWTNLLVLPYLLVIAGVLLVHPGVRRLRVAALGLPAFVLGSLPFWLANLSSGWATFHELAGANTGGASTLLLIPRRLGGVVALAGPVLLGLVPPDSNVERFAAERAAQPLAFAAGTVLALLLLALAAYRLLAILRRGWRGLLVAREVPLLALGALAPLAFAVDKVASLHYGEPRYLLPLYATVPLFAGFVARLSRSPAGLDGVPSESVGARFIAPAGSTLESDRPGGEVPPAPLSAAPDEGAVDVAAAVPGGRDGPRPYSPHGRLAQAVAALIVAAALALNLWSNLTFDPGLSTAVVGGRPLPVSSAELIAFLLARGDTRIYADYWIAYPVALESGEQVVAGVIGDDLRRGYNRYIPYPIAVDAAPSPAYVFAAGSPQDQAFGEKLRGIPATFERAEVDGYAVYDRIEPPQRPSE